MARGERDGIDEIEGDVTAIRLPFLLLLWQDFMCQLSFSQIPILQIGK